MEKAAENNSKLKGAKIRTANYLMILGACILFLFILYGMFKISSQYDTLLNTTENYINCENIASRVYEGSNILTEQVRLYVVTADPVHVDTYFQEANVDKKRERALEELEKIHSDDEVHNYLQQALDYSNELMKVEIYSMHLITQAKHYDLEDFPKEIQDVELSAEDLALDEEAKVQKAQEMVFGEAYTEAKQEIIDNIFSSLETVLKETSLEQKNSAKSLRTQLNIQRVEISVLFIMNVVIFMFITILIVKPLQIYIKCIKDNKALEITGAYEFKYLALTYNDIYEVNAANEIMLRKKAEKDALTGIMNRAGFEQLREGLKTKPVPICFLLIDVDVFKSINDTYGHETGDQALQKVAELLTNTFRSTDFPSRIGGDEFAVVMTEVDVNSRQIIEAKATEMNEILQRGEDGLPKFSLSIGIAFSKQGFDDGLYSRADQALYRVKEAGRCGYAFYEDL